MRKNDDFKIAEELFTLSEPQYQKFTASLLPTLKSENILGVRVPHLRKIAKRILKNGGAADFLNALPHKYYEENYIHALLISELEYSECIFRINSFLPYVDNWGVCDGLRPACFSSNKDELAPKIATWLSSEHTYTVRFAIEMLMLHFLGDRFEKKFFDAVASIRSEEYYLNMMIAWYFATALAERYDEALPYLENHRFSAWVHNKIISKARESLRISSAKKQYLNTLKIKMKG